MGLFDRRTPPQGPVLPTPHGPAETPLAAEEPEHDDADLPDDEDDLVLTPVWPARPGGPRDPSAAADDEPLVPLVPATLADGNADPEQTEPGDGPEPGTAAEPHDGPAPADLGHTVDELNPAERIWLAQQRALVADLCDDPTDAAAVAALFDRVRTQWAQAAERPDHRPLADAFGVALGDLVVARAPAMRWAAVSDRFGTEIVLAHGQPEVLVYPLASVAQYWEDARPGWFAEQVERLVQTVRGALPAAG
ncbi:DUF3806 domain-containing protein [Cellulomonas sp.]|uniref:DUF3806 domain-containing protein n=1 Tax=Cellulomonas sp. TaxID=40001 RepID=UPI0028113E3C|nr:DUF3806 domain-containing protein [Cellulomonas sp.]